MMTKRLFAVDDLSDYAREVAGKDPKIVPLERGKFVTAGSYKVFLLDVLLSTGYSCIKALVGRYQGYPCDSDLESGPVTVEDCHLIPNTNLILDIWVDRLQGGVVVPLLFQKGSGVTILEDFMSVATNLPESVLEKVAKAVITKRVVWDEGKTNLVGEGCDGEFVFEGCRYSFDEVFESPSGLFLIEGNLEYIGNLLEILEAERVSLLNSHQYSKAKDVHEKMESLKKVLQRD